MVSLCCDKAKGLTCKVQVTYDKDSKRWCVGDRVGSTLHGIKHCPFCGIKLSCESLDFPEDPVVIASRPSGPKFRFVFDVDGVICNDRDKSIPYAERKPYRYAAQVIRHLHESGHEIIFATARYMMKFDGDQQKAKDHGLLELKTWLRQYDIPFHEAYLGKPSGDVYVDDKAVRVMSNRGTIDWQTFYSEMFSCPSIPSPAQPANHSTTS